MTCSYCGQELNVVGICVNVQCPGEAGAGKEPEKDRRPAPPRPARAAHVPPSSSRPWSTREICQQAISDGVRIQVDYDDARGTRTRRKLSPASLSGDMLVAYCHMRNGGRHFKLSRMVHARILSERAEETHLHIAREAADEGARYRMPYFGRRSRTPTGSPTVHRSAPTKASSSSGSGCLVWIAIIIGGWMLLAMLQ